MKKMTTLLAITVMALFVTSCGTVQGGLTVKPDNQIKTSISGPATGTYKFEYTPNGSVVRDNGISLGGDKYGLKVNSTNNVNVEDAVVPSVEPVVPE